MTWYAQVADKPGTAEHGLPKPARTNPKAGERAGGDTPWELRAAGQRLCPVSGSAWWLRGGLARRPVLNRNQLCRLLSRVPVNGASALVQGV